MADEVVREQVVVKTEAVFENVDNFRPTDFDYENEEAREIYNSDLIEDLDSNQRVSNSSIANRIIPGPYILGL